MMRPRDRRRGQSTLIDGDNPVVDGFAMAKEANIVAARNRGVANIDLPGQQATAQQTRTSVRNSFSGQASGHFSGLSSSDLRDDVPTNYAENNATISGGEDRRTPENLPAIISTAIALTEDMIIPQWHKVCNLPAFCVQQVRSLGRQIFKEYTDIPVDDIQTCTTLTNDVREVQAMMGWIKKNGVRNDEMKYDFNDIMPGYHADVQSWDAEGYSFLLVRDHSGHYVYGWPGGRGVHLTEEAPRPMLR